jgi:hypothetical protein
MLFWSNKHVDNDRQSEEEREMCRRRERAGYQRGWYCWRQARDGRIIGGTPGRSTAETGEVESEKRNLGDQGEHFPVATGRDPRAIEDILRR